MVSDRSWDTYVGSVIQTLLFNFVVIINISFLRPTNNDEMCNFYLMYYVKDGSPLDMKYCITQGPPHYYWDTHLNRIPSIEASTL